MISLVVAVSRRGTGAGWWCEQSGRQVGVDWTGERHHWCGVGLDEGRGGSLCLGGVLKSRCPEWRPLRGRLIMSFSDHVSLCAYM